jgi:uncharacterized protein (TIGR02246 family)
MALYAEDAVLMPANAATQVGEQALRSFYQTLFQQIALELIFTPVETQVFGEWVFARVSIAGTRTHKDSGKAEQVDNKVMLLLQQDDQGAWKIARQIFNSNLPNAE